MTARRARSTGPAGTVERAEGTGPTARAAQVIAAGVLGVISALLMVTTHRAQLDVAGVSLPIGLIIGGAFQLAASIFLVTATGRRLPLLVLTIVWGLVALPFAGRGAGGGILMPAAIGGVPQYSGWIVQGLGVLIPLLVLAALWILRIRRLTRERARHEP